MADRPKILCVDDEVDNVDALERLFRKKYQVLKATSGTEALSLLEKNDFSVIISDQRMPKMTGVELLAQAYKLQPDSIRILLTGYTDIDAVIAAINTGHVYRYVAKPWDSVDLANAVDKAVERFQLGRLVVEKNRQLEKALTELRSLDEAKSRFMILVNHELKTPLTAILSFGDLLNEAGLNEEQTKYLDRIRSSTLRLQALVHDVLQIMLASTSQLKIQPGAVEPTRWTDLLSPAVSTQAQKRNVTLASELKPIAIHTDERILKDIISRLLMNAARYAEPGSTAVLKNGIDHEACRFAVESLGPPVSRERIEGLDKPFQVSGSIMNHSGGTGLGWSVCQALLGSLGSRLEIDSQAKGDGLAVLTVSFRIPLV